MNITLTPEQDEAAERLVEAGLYTSKDAAVAYSNEWLREEAKKLEAIRAAIKLSEEQSALGESRPLDADKMIARLRKRLEERSNDRPE